MPQFEFKFQTVLRHRQIVEDQAQRELAQVMRQRMILMNQLRSMQDSIRQSKHDLGASLVGQVSMAQVGDFARYSGQVTQRAQQLVTGMASVEQRIVTARDKLLTATRARKAMELLRDRQHQEWKRQQDRRETAELDELAVQGHARQLTEVPW
ncbi:MAG: flagellar export protein FliJ [Phycisphaeraceae bacterium]